MEAKALSAKYGIPAAIPIPNHRRYSYCVANEAILTDVSSDGKYATYSGVCSCGHLYRDKIETEELRRKSKVVIKNGEQVVELRDKQMSTQELEEF